IEDHHMHSESYEMSEAVAKKLNQARQMHKRIISVGTTSTRTLESIYSKYGCFKACKEDTNIFIYPGYEFKAIDGLITNFHLPKSTIIMLVSAFASRDIIINAYNEAVKEKYRFFSFGDAMFIY
ncbi:MAG: S-adenosylmethionine:tRNA ribosyltransferase-isomerase, partial [Bacilli bacterium]|nr:S-adenosylmethionine:tRNA ribosyltransferase-isomerase [Bacilli bacterium]